MRIKIAIGVIILAAITLFLLNGKSVNEVIESNSTLPYKINSQANVDNGKIVFYEHTNQNDFTASLLQKSIIGYKLVYTGSQGDLKRSVDEKGMTVMYFPEIKGTSTPLLFGVVGLPEIEQVIVKDSATGKEQEAKIINTDHQRIWILDLNDLKFDKVVILGRSNDKRIVVELEELKLSK